MKKIIVIFKTHLDVGYTELAETVVEKYNREFIPNAIDTAEKLCGRPEGFVWTVGSWLIHQYLETAPEAEANRLRRAIEAGMIRWHALPFTMHSEAASAELFEYGLSLSKELDAEFGLNTIGAKCTDVPGHTIGIVPLLSRAGVKMLHIGTNGGCAVPEVPEVFRWVDESDEIIIVYNDGYGGFTKIPETEIGVYFAHTYDNVGPPTAEQVAEVYEKLHTEYPEAEIKAGTLCDMAAELEKVRDILPTVTSEIGDTWIHGVASDPQKMNRYRALLRLAKNWDEAVQRKLYKHLLMVPEHTWGLDEKTHLGDKEHFTREAFDPMRGDARCVKMERSWQEQREYIDKAIAALDEPYRAMAQASQAEHCIPLPDLSAYTQVDQTAAKSGLCKNGWTVAFDESGAVTKLEKDGVTYADGSHRLATLRYEVSSDKVIADYISRYCTVEGWWIQGDFGKDGLPKELEQKSYTAQCENIYENDEGYIVILKSENEAHERFGFPVKTLIKLSLTADRALFDFAWFDKPALRLPESFWLGFKPMRPLTSIQKMGRWINPKDVVSKGAREIHGTDGLMDFDGMMLNTLDASVVAIDKPCPYAFYNQIPACDNGVWLNLYNNLWGVNFTMWYRDDARFRVELLCL